MLGICFLRGVPEDVVVVIGEGEKRGCGEKRGLNKWTLTSEPQSGKRESKNKGTN